MTADDASKPMAVATYLFKRIEQLGTRNIIGVPGDFNLLLLDYVLANPNMNWIGFCNELNAAYSADGYSRASGIPGVFITTYGVGELSALNGVSGACAEQVPMIHIVGTTSRPAMDNHVLLHHTKPDGTLNPVDHKVFMETSRPYSVAHEFLDNPATAAEQIDKVITEVYRRKLPGYIFIPTDMVAKPLSKGADRLINAPLDLSYYSSVDDATSLEEKLATQILDLIYGSKSPVFLIDVLSERFKLRPELKKLVTESDIWTFTTHLGKATVDETLPQFVSSYAGKIGPGGSAKAVEEDSDLVIHFGPLLSDANTGAFTMEISKEKLVELHELFVSIKGKVYKGVHFVPVIKKIVEKFDASKMTFKATADNKPKIEAFKDPKSEEITQTQLVTAFSKYLKPNDTFLVECGCFQYDAHYVKLPENVKYWTQIFYSCIGYTLPAALGAAIAKKEHGASGRVVLVEGDGSSMMTIQELGTIIRHKLPVIIFLLNNSGYSIERAIWGPEQSYNDICPNWKWTELLTTLGGTKDTCQSFQVRTRQDFDKILEAPELQSPTKTTLVEVIMDKFDYSNTLNEGVKIMGAVNMKGAKEYAAAKGEI